MVITEAKIRMIIKEEIKKVLNENMDETEQASKLIAAMNQINSKYDSMRIGQKVPPYKADGNLFSIKEFINNNVSGAVIEDYLDELKSQQDLDVEFSTDDYSEDGYVTSIHFN
jgi:hypothetical protein